MKLLVVDGDAAPYLSHEHYLGSRDLRIQVACDERQAIACLHEQGFDLVLLEVAISGHDRFSLLREIRKQWPTPVVVVTSCTEEVDRIIGLELGADDYLTKPFNPGELVARIRAVLRRRSPEGLVSDDYIEVSGIRLDTGRRSVEIEDRRLQLTLIEFQLLRALMRSAGHVVSRDQLCEAVYRREQAPYDRSVDVHVSHLRRKLGPAGACIKTIRGIGYFFACTSSDATSLPTSLLNRGGRRCCPGTLTRKETQSPAHASAARTEVRAEIYSDDTTVAKHQVAVAPSE